MNIKKHCDKRILVITHQLSRTGAPIVLMDMIEIYHRNGYKVDVITMLDGELRSKLEDMNIPVTVMNHFVNMYVEFYKLAHNYDMVIANTLITFEVIHILNDSKVPVMWWLHEGKQYFEYFAKVLPDFKRLSSNIHVFSVGHYVRDVLVSAIRMLDKRYSDKAEFFFCGNQENYDENIFLPVKLLSEEYDNVTMLALMPRDKMLELKDECDCIIVPSRVDPIPTVAAEMMKESACFCTDVCGIANYIQDGINGYTVSAEDAVSLKEKIEYIIEHSKDMKTIGKAGRKIYEEHFSMAVFEPKVLALAEEYI